MHAADLPVINMLWIGPRLGPVERLSIASFLAHGHAVKLHAYDAIGDVPDGAVLVDAAATVPRARLESLRNTNGSYALASDYFRFALLRQPVGLWADADMVALAPIALDGPNLFGLETAQSINGAILGLAPGSPLLGEALAAFTDNAIPSWVSFNRKRQLWMKRLAGRTFTPADHHWGTFGPMALTGLARRHGLFGEAAPVDVFYPVPIANAHLPFAPGSRLEALVSERTRGLHLWRNVLGELGRQPAPADSAIGALNRRFGL
jgi:hypothetical protein